MKYYNAGIFIENNIKRYGNLPVDFVIGYETENEVFFELMEEVLLPDDAGVTEIDKSTYQSKIEEISQAELVKRRQQEQAFVDELTKKKDENNYLKETLLVQETVIEELMFSIIPEITGGI